MERVCPEAAASSSAFVVSTPADAPQMVSNIMLALQALRDTSEANGIVPEDDSVADGMIALVVCN